jgi:hypothetical protein
MKSGAGQFGYGHFLNWYGEKAMQVEFILNDEALGTIDSPRDKDEWDKTISTAFESYEAETPFWTCQKKDGVVQVKIQSDNEEITSAVREYILGLLPPNADASS